MTKGRNRSNRIGAAGEAAFASFATDRGLLPTKAQEDVGIDFVCQVDIDPASFGTSRIAGGFVGFAVRATEASDHRARLSRDDAELLLRMDAPVGVVLVDGAPNARTFYHRMVDEEFAQELATFLDSNQQSLSVSPTRCHGEARFHDDVLNALRPGEVERRRLAVAEARLTGKLGHVQIDIARNAAGALTLVSKFQFWDMFRDLDDEQRELLRLATFGAPELFPDRLEAMAVPADLVAELDGLPTPYVLGGEVRFRESELVVEGPNGRATGTFRETGNNTHYGHIHDAGFALTVSERQQHEGRWVHWLSALVDPDVALDLAEHPDLWTFLAAAVSGATIVDVDRPTWRFEVSAFGDLWRIGRLAACMKDAAGLPGWSSEIAQLRDADDDETGHALNWLSAVGRDITMVPPVSFETQLNQRSGFDRNPGLWRVPVIANTRRAGVLTWLTCAGDVLTRDDRIVGVDTKKYLNVRIEIREQRFPKTTILPEFVFQPELHTIAIGGTPVLEAVAPIGGRGPEGFVALSHPEEEREP